MDSGRGAGVLAREWLQATFPQTVFKHQIASLLRQDQAATDAEGDEQGSIGFLQVRQAPAIAILGERRSGHGMSGYVWRCVGRAPRPPSSDCRIIHRWV